MAWAKRTTPTSKSSRPEFHRATPQDFTSELSNPPALPEQLQVALRAAQCYGLGTETITGLFITDVLQRPADEDD